MKTKLTISLRDRVLTDLLPAEAAAIDGGFCGLFPQIPMIGPDGFPIPVPCDGYPEQQQL